MGLEWVEGFYSRTGSWWGPAEARVSERDRARVRMLRAHAGDGPARVLELGSGYGMTAVAAVEDGFDVTAVELSDRVRHTPAMPGLTVAGGSFYDVTLDGRFDVVCYWNGFGVGTDQDQRRLLRRIAAEWLRPGGVALIDVFNPLVWARLHGTKDHKFPDPSRGYAHELHQEIHFDAATSTAHDTWWDAATPDEKITQVLRCYSPADLRLLLEGTGLRLDTVTSRAPGGLRLLTESYEYTAVLLPVDTGDPVQEGAAER
ncbi:class I SAM-dependent methyltransferase [Catenuloplanes japonicus]|uniref:class I SAM-dependent methyltransferase n=1 Tax=Catenuloplanes japonicus TaxID=33876 RepID=UPI00068E0037|nr:methyltransferase domain-containing protein [Catenuloplanes japonicus]